MRRLRESPVGFGYGKTAGDVFWGVQDGEVEGEGVVSKQVIEGLPPPPDGYEWGEITALQVDCMPETPPENWYYVGRLQLRRRSQVVFSNGTTTATLTIPEDLTAKSRRKVDG